MPLYDAQFRQLVANSITAGTSTAKIVEALEISRRTVDNYRHNIRTFGVYNSPPASIPHYPQKIHLATQEAMIELLHTNPTIYLDEVQDWLFNKFEIDVSIPTVHRYMKRLNLTQKKNKQVNSSSDSTLRALWLFKIASRYSAKQLVVIDESIATKRTQDRW